MISIAQKEKKNENSENLAGSKILTLEKFHHNEHAPWTPAQLDQNQKYHNNQSNRW